MSPPQFFSAYLLVSLEADLKKTSEKVTTSIPGSRVRKLMKENPEWDKGTGWKNRLNNLRLISHTILLFQSPSFLVKGVSHSPIIFGISSLNCFDEFFP